MSERTATELIMGLSPTISEVIESYKLKIDRLTAENERLEKEIKLSNIDTGYWIYQTAQRCAEIAEQYHDPWSRPNGDAKGIADDIRKEFGL